MWRRAGMRELLAEGSREFGSSGCVFTRDEIVAELEQEEVAELIPTDFEAERLGDGCVMVTYRARRMKCGSAGRVALRSSIWEKHRGECQVVFHEGLRSGRTPTSESTYR